MKNKTNKKRKQPGPKRDLITKFLTKILINRISKQNLEFSKKHMRNVDTFKNKYPETTSKDVDRLSKIKTLQFVLQRAEEKVELLKPKGIKERRIKAEETVQKVKAEIKELKDVK
tara:strand:- start:4493 stop:4837 length:345 start_codon:yes stop_codon:yes gene_type:complete